MTSLETWVWVFLFVVVLPAVAVGCGLFIRRRVGTEVLARHNDVAGFIYAVVGVVYAVLLGFTAIIVWEQFQDAQSTVEREADALVDLYRDSRVFPPEARDAVELHVRAYARLAVEKEWRAMAEGHSSDEVWAEYNELWRTYHEFEPSSDHQRLWYAESLHRLNELADARRGRLLSMQSAVPAVMWAVLIGGCVITLGFSFMFGTRNTRAQAIMTAGLALMIGGVLLSIFALQGPFTGITRVDPEPFHQVGRILEQWRQPAGAP